MNLILRSGPKDRVSKDRGKRCARGHPSRLAASAARTSGSGRVHTLNGFPFSGTITFVVSPFIAATNASAFGSMIGNEP